MCPEFLIFDFVNTRGGFVRGPRLFSFFKFRGRPRDAKIYRLRQCAAPEKPCHFRGAWRVQVRMPALKKGSGLSRRHVKLRARFMSCFVALFRIFTQVVFLVVWTSKGPLVAHFSKKYAGEKGSQGRLVPESARSSEKMRCHFFRAVPRR